MKLLFTLFLALGMLLTASPDSAARGGRPSFRSGSSFRSRPSYSGFRSSPSRSFTFGRSSSTYSTPSRPSYTPSTRSRRTTVINNHYDSPSSHGGGGFGLMDFAIMHSLLSHDDHGPAQPVIVQQPAVSYSQPQDPVQVQQQPAVYQAAPQEESHWLRNTFFFLLGAGILYGGYRVVKAVFTSLAEE